MKHFGFTRLILNFARDYEFYSDGAYDINPVYGVLDLGAHGGYGLEGNQWVTIIIIRTTLLR